MLEEFEKEISLKKNPSIFLYTIAIGAFAINSIFEFSSLVTYIFKDILIISLIEPSIIHWLPDFTSLISFIVVLIGIVNFFIKNYKLGSKKTLVKTILIFFSIIAIQFCYSYFVSPVLKDNYSTAYEIYYDNIDGYYEIMTYQSFVPILKYLIM